MRIELKSTGTLIDENITTDLKLLYLGETPEIRRRKNALETIINKRLFHKSVEPIKLFELTNKLRTVLEACWKAQEIVMKYSKNESRLNSSEDNLVECAYAAIDAQRYNIRRNILIREIDEFLGESEITQLVKSYA